GGQLSTPRCFDYPLALSMIFHLNQQVASTLYFADLIGASLGALLVTVLLEWVGSESTLLLVAAAPLAASAFLSKRHRTVVVWGALIVVGFAVSNGRVLLFRVTPGTLKAMRRHMQDNARLRLTQTGWNAYSRIGREHLQQVRRRSQ